MKVKANNVVRELKERQNTYVLGEDACAYQTWRTNENTLRMYIPLDIDRNIKAWRTNDQTNSNLLHGFFSIIAKSDGTVTHPPYADTSLSIVAMYRVAGGITIDFLAPGEIMGGMYIIQNLLTIELY